jgi:patatin-like phospholipase/acyl hydrolase
MRILSIDGGGIRGVIPATVLAAIEQRTGRPAAELFDLIAGTSTGGILACALARAGPDGRPVHTAEHLRGLYLDDGPRIFHRSLLRRVLSVEGWLDERYGSEGLEASLREHLGASRLRETVCDVFVTAYELRLREAFFFRSTRARGHDLPAGATAEAYDFALADVALATSAAPTYFEPAEITSAAGDRYGLIDGGVFATNPAMCAYAEARRTGAADDLLVVSLGTGRPTHQHAIDVEEAKGWGRLGWARPVIDVIFDGVSDTVEFELGRLGGVDYVRLQTPLRHAREALDDAGADNLAGLRRDADALVADHAAELDALAARLVA